MCTCNQPIDSQLSETILQYVSATALSRLNCASLVLDTVEGRKPDNPYK